MTLQQTLPFVTTAILVVLTLDIFRRYNQHKGAHRHLLYWGLGLAMFAAASLAEGVLNLTYNEIAFDAWYLFGAVLTAAWIGQGTVYLLFRRRWVDGLTIVLVVGSVIAAVILLATQLNPGAYHAGTPISEQYQEILPKGGVRLTTPIFNIYGTLTLVGGALWSGYLFWRKQILPNRVLGNVLIAAGALAIAFASSLTRLGFGAFLALGQLAFAILIYAGFIVASQPATVEERGTPPSAQVTAN